MPSKIRKTLTIGRNPITGLPIRKNFCGKTKKEVQEKIDRYKIEMATGHKQDCEIMTFDTWADRWLEVYKEGSVAEKTYKDYALAIRHLNEYFEKLPLNAITPVMLRNFFKSKSHLSQSMVDKLRVTANAIFETAVDNDMCLKNPFRNLGSLKGVPTPEKRHYTKEQAALVSAFAQEHSQGLGVYIILNSGLRRGELMGLTPKDIDLKNGRLHMCRTVTDDGKVKDHGKSKSASRVIPLAPSVVAYLKSRPELHGKEALFHGRSKPFLVPSDWVRYRYTLFTKDLHTAYPDLPILTPHELRHTYGTLLYENGTDLLALKSIMGHSSIEITAKTYIHTSAETLEKKIKWG